MATKPYFIVNVEAAIYHNGAYLIIERGDTEEHSPGTLSLPGGKVDAVSVSPEALESALKKEIYEEVGMRLKTFAYLESKSFTMDTGDMCLSIAFLCQDFSGVATAKSPYEVKSVKWLTWAEIIKHPSVPTWTVQSVTAAERWLAKLEARK